jgi:hypothetical protein
VWDPEEGVLLHTLRLPGMRSSRLSVFCHEGRGSLLVETLQENDNLVMWCDLGDVPGQQTAFVRRAGKLG